MKKYLFFAVVMIIMTSTILPQLKGEWVRQDNWQGGEKVIAQFWNNDLFKMYIDNNLSKGTWRLSGNTLSIALNGMKEELYSLSWENKEKITLERGGVKYIFAKKDSYGDNFDKNAGIWQTHLKLQTMWQMQQMQQGITNNSWNGGNPNNSDYDSYAPKRHVCPSCYGTGTCRLCNGSGIYRMYGQSGPCSCTNGKCSQCGGTGYLIY